MKKILIGLLIFFALFEIGSLINDALAHGPVKTLYFRRCNYNPGVRWQVRYQVIFNDNSRSGYIYGTTGPESAHGDYYAEEVCNSFAGRIGASEPLVNTGSNAADPPHPGGFISSRLGPRDNDTRIIWSTACVDPIIDPITVYEAPSGHNIWEFVEDVSFRQNLNGCTGPGCNGFNSGGLRDVVRGKGTINFSEVSKCSNNPPPPRNVIRGFVFIDRNSDGDYDNSDLCYKNRFNILRNGDPDNYSATGCGGGNDPYFVWTTTRTNNTICLDVPNGYRMTNNRCRDTNGDATLRFGIALDRGEISGIVYIDENNNGGIDGNDTRRRDDLVRIDPNGANDTRRTDRDGRYRFGDLNPGSDHNIRLDGINTCRLNIMGDNPKTNINAPAGGNNNVHFRLTRRYFEIVGNVYRYVAGECTPTINTNCQAYGRSVKVTAVGTGRSDDSKPGDSPDYKITRIQDQGGAYTVRLTGLRTGESVVGGNEKDVNINCANERQDFYIQPAGATEFDIAGTVYVDSNNDGALQKATDEIYDGGGTVQIRTGNNSASTGRTGTVRNNGTYTVIDNPQNTNYTVRLQQATLASGYTVLNNDRPVNLGTSDISQINFLVDAPANTYSMRGGVYIDSSNPEGKKTAAEPYEPSSGTERIRIQGLPAGANCPQNRSSFVRDITGFTGEFIASGIQPGCYRVEFNGPNGRGADWRVTYPSGISPFTIGPIIVGPNCNDDATDQDGVALCATGAGGTPNGNVTNIDFGIKQQDDNPWYQSVGGDVRVDVDDYRNIIPDGTSPICANSTYPYVSSNSVSGNLSSGIVFTGNNPNLSNSGTDRSKASDRGWLVTGNEFSPSRPGTIRTSYTYMDNIIEKGRLTVNQMFGSTATKACTANSGPDCTFRANLLNGIYKSKNTVTIRGSGNPETYTFPDGRDYVFLIEDDLRIESNIQINPGSTVTFIVLGDIIISPDVTELDGIYSTDGSFITLGITTGANDTPLRIEGNVIANAGLNAGEKFDQRRDLGDAQNVDCPAVTFISRPDFILNGPELIRYTNYVIQEIAPGADRGSQGAAGFLIADTYTPPFTPVPNTPTPRPPTPEPEEPSNTPRPSPRPSQEPEEDNFPFFCQYGAVNKNGWVPEADRGSWDYVYDGNKQCNIYGSGCAMASLAMIMKYFGDNMNPETTSKQATNNKYPINLGCQSPGTLTSQITNTVVPWLRNRNYSVPGGDQPNQVQFTFDSQGDYRGRINLKVLKTYLDHGYLLLGGAKITMATRQGLSEPAGHAFVITDINVENETMTAYDPTFCQKDYPNLQGGKRTIRNVNSIGGNPIGCSSGDCGWVQMFAIKKRGFNPTSAPTRTPSPIPTPAPATINAGLTVPEASFQFPTTPAGGQSRSVTSHGATCNNSSNDDTVGIKAAIAAAVAGDEVTIPANCTLHLKTWPIDLKTGVNIKGQDKTTSVLSGMFTTAANPIFYARTQSSTSTNQPVSNLSITNFSYTTLSGTPPNTIIKLGTGTWNTNNSEWKVVNKIRIENLTIEKFRKYAIDIQNSQFIYVANNIIKNATNLGGGGEGYGIKIDMDKSQNNWIKGNTIGPVIRHAYLVQYDANHNLFDQNSATGTSNDAFDLHGEGEYSNEFRNNTVTNCVATDPYSGAATYGSGFGIGEVPTSTSAPPGDAGHHDFSGDNNWIHDNTVSGCYSGVRINNTNNTYVDNNTITNNRSGGILVGDLDTYIFPELASNPPSYGTNNTTVRSNTVKNNPVGFRIKNAKTAKILNNIATNNTGAGLTLTSQTTGYTITGNDFRFNGSTINLGGNTSGTFSNNQQ